MPITRDLSNNYIVTDWTRELNIIPNTWGTINNLGIFTNESVTESSVTFQEVQKDFGLVVDRVRGDRNSVNKDYIRKLHTFLVPHFPLDDQILPKDVVGKSAYEDLNVGDRLDKVRMRKMERIRNSHAITLEYARAQLITQGTVYAPNSTVSQDWFAEFGITQTSVDFKFADAASDILGITEKAIAAIQDNSQGLVGGMTGIVALCGPTFFSRLISHAKITTAYQYYTTSGAQQPLRERLGGKLTYNRMFDYGGVVFIEMRDTYNGNALIPTGECRFIPTGTDLFRTYFAPCERFGFEHTEGQEIYMFEEEMNGGKGYTIETESNFANAIMKPAVIIKGMSST